MAINSKARLFTPSVVRNLISSTVPVVSQIAADLSGSSIDDRSFRLDGPGAGLKSTQQLNVDWSKFENHTFFNSAEAKVNVSFDAIINNYPFDGTKKEVENFFNRLTGYERYIFDLFPKSVGSINFTGDQENVVAGFESSGSYVIVTDRAGALFPSLSNKKAEAVLDPGENSISVEMFLYVPSGKPRKESDEETYNENQIICQKLDIAGITGFTLGLLDSRLKNSLVQETDSDGNLLWYVGGDPKSAKEAGYSEKTGNPPVYWSELQWAEYNSYEPVLVENKKGLTNCDLFFLISSGSSYLSASMDISKGKWNHICAVFDRTPGIDKVKLYLDGKLQAQSENSYAMNSFSLMLDEDSVKASVIDEFKDDESGIAAYVSFLSAPFTIASGSIHFQGAWQGVSAVSSWDNETDVNSDGIPDGRYNLTTRFPNTVITQETDNTVASNVKNCFKASQIFSGSIDELRVWHSVRTEGSIKSYMGRTVYADTPGNLKLCYKFNEAPGIYLSNDLLLDSSGNSLHAKIKNYHVNLNRNIDLNKNLITGELGDPEDNIVSPMIFERESMSPILFPSHPDVIALNKSLLNQATWYDTNNPNLITKLIPPHYLQEGQTENGFSDMFSNDVIAYDASPTPMPGNGQLTSPQIIQSILFTWARYFDEIKIFLDHFSKLLNIDYESKETIPDNFLPFLANYYGIKLPKIFVEGGLEQYLDGENITPDKGLSDLSLQFVQNQIWRRILVNVNEIIQSKGTVHGIRALMLSMGVSPDNIMRFREYGGSRTKTLDDVRKTRIEVAAMLDFSGTLQGVKEHRPAPGIGNPFYYNVNSTESLSMTNPWETDILDSLPDPNDNSGDDDTDDYIQSPFVSPFIMSPFLSGSRVEIGPCNPDAAIPVASATLTIDYSLPADSDYEDLIPRYRESAGYLADASLLDKKIVRFTDVDGNRFLLQFKGNISTEILKNAIEINIIGVSDRIEIAQKIVDVINDNTTLKAYNTSSQNNGVISLYQPRGGRAGNYPIESLQIKNDALVTWDGLIQAIDKFGNKLWKVPNDSNGEIVQAIDTDGNKIYTPDAGSTFNNVSTDSEVYQFPLSAVGYTTNPQKTVLNKEGNSMIGVWKHAVTGELITYEDHPDYGDYTASSGGVFSDDDMRAPYEPVLLTQSEDDYAQKYGYVPVYNRKPYFEISGFSGGNFGFIRSDHPDLNDEESLFVKQNGSYHGFDFTRGDGLLTSGSWTIEAIYKFDKPKLTFYPVTQSLMRLQSTYRNNTSSSQKEKHVALTNLVCMRKPVFDEITEEEIITRDGTIKLFVRPELVQGSNPQLLVLEVTGVNVFDGHQWNISYGRERADQINSAISSSYFLRVSRNASGEIAEYYEDKKLFLETLHPGNKTFWSDYDVGDLGSAEKNVWGSFIAIGSQSLPPSTGITGVDGLGLNDNDFSKEKICTHFSGKIAQLRFWSKALTVSETKEHTRNIFSLGVENPVSNFNFAMTPSGSWERLRLDISFDQQEIEATEDELVDQAFIDAGLNPIGWFRLFDFSQAIVSGSRGALWRKTDNKDEMKYHMYGYGFGADTTSIKPERFDCLAIDPKFDEQSVQNKIRIRGFQQLQNIEEFNTDVAPVHEVLPSETPSDDTRFSIDISSYQALNDDIIKIFATLDSLDNIIGSPENVFTQSYPDLEFLREVYFNRLSDKVKIRSFFEFFKWFDNAIGELIKTLVPRKTHFLGVNFVVESHMLERAKMTYNYSDVYLGQKNRHGLKGTMTLQQFVGQVKRF